MLEPHGRQCALGQEPGELEFDLLLNHAVTHQPDILVTLPSLFQFLYLKNESLDT